MSDYFLNKVYDSLLTNKTNSTKTKSSFRTLSESYNLVYEQNDDNVRRKQQDRIAFINQKMRENPEVINSIYKKLVVVDQDLPTRKKERATYQEEPLKTNPSYWLQPELTKPEKDHLQAQGAYKKTLIGALMSSDADTDEIEAFLKNYGKVSYVDVDKLLQEGPQPTSNYLVEAEGVSKKLVEDIFRYMFGEKAGTRGPGEVSLALLSPQITFAPKGDLLIKNIPVEVKGEGSKGGGRLKDSQSSFGTPLLAPIYNELPNTLPNVESLKLPSNTFTAAPNPGRRGSGEASVNILDHAKRLNSVVKGLGDRFMQEMVKTTYKFVDAKDYHRLFPNINEMDREQAFNAIARMCFLNYKQELLNKTPEPFNHILFITPEKSLFFNLNNLEQYIPYFSFHSIDFKDKINGPAVQVSLK